MNENPRPPAAFSTRKSRKPEVLTPVALSLFLGPGTGQLYNREYRSGFVFIALALVVLTVGFGWFFAALQRVLPPDFANADPAALAALLKDAVDQVQVAHAGLVHTFVTLFVLLQGASAVDAYYGSHRRFHRLETQSAKEGL